MSRTETLIFWNSAKGIFSGSIFLASNFILWSVQPFDFAAHLFDDFDLVENVGAKRQIVDNARFFGQQSGREDRAGAVFITGNLDLARTAAFPPFIRNFWII